MIEALERLLREGESGQTMAEYAVILGVISLAIVTALGVLSGAISTGIGAVAGYV
jgi:Flp pilus assembly pilin Flp